MLHTPSSFQALPISLLAIHIDLTDRVSVLNVNDNVPSLPSLRPRKISECNQFNSFLQGFFFSYL